MVTSPDILPCKYSQPEYGTFVCMYHKNITPSGLPLCPYDSWLSAQEDCPWYEEGESPAIGQNRPRVVQMAPVVHKSDPRWEKIHKAIKDIARQYDKQNPKTPQK